MELTRTPMLRARWAAIGAAVAVTLGGGGIGITHALTTSGDRPIYLPLDSPCRLSDLRPAPFQVGPRSAPLGPNEIYTLDGWGAEGDCNLPADTAGLELNVTALEATAATFLRFWPGDGAEPDTANLNPTPGQPPIPNSVTVGLSGADGTFKIFNRFGNVAVVIDVVGIYDDHHHDDRYYTEGETDTQLAAKADAVDVYTKDQIDASTANGVLGVGLISGTAVAGGWASFGLDDATVTNPSTGTYTIRFPGLDPGCVNDAPTALLDPTNAGYTAGINSSTCSGATGDTTLTISVRDSANAAANSAFFMIVFANHGRPLIEFS